MEEERRNNTGTLVGLILMAVLAAVFGFLYFKEHEITTQQAHYLESRISELASSEIKLDSISRKLDVTIVETQELGGEVKQLQAIKTQLEADRAMLRKGSVQMSTKIREYETFLTRKDGELTRLRSNNQELSSQAENLSSANVSLKERNLNVADSLSGVLARAKELENKVAAGSAPRISNIRVYAVSTNGKVREGERVRSRRVDKLRVDFFMEKNPLAALGDKQLYLRLIDPKGATISNTQTGSGTMTVEGKEMPYTSNKSISFDNSGKEENIVYDINGDIPSGIYAVELYGEGMLLATGAFSIR